MLTVLGSIWWLIVTLGLLVTFHEFGHYWVARRCGVKVLRFSVGFGRPIKSWYGKDGTQYCVAWIPLGGYVKMLDAREGEVSAEEKDAEFTGKSVWKRIAIVIAGPGFNLIFAVLAFWLMFMVGRPGVVPVLGTPAAGTLAAEAGFQAGDTIESIDGRKVGTWGGALDLLGDHMLAHEPVQVVVARANGTPQTLTLPLQKLPTDVDVAKAFAKTGLQARPVPALAARIEPNSPAAKAGLQAGDRILAIDGKPITRFGQIGARLHTLSDPGTTLQFTLQRDGRTLTVPVQPTRRDPGDGGGMRWMVGIAAPPRPTATIRHAPIDALGLALGTTWDKTATSFALVGKMLIGHASPKNLGGPITIARAADASAQRGFAWFLSFLGLISLSLGVLNLLPIPILDGGHLLYYLIELVKGQPVSERTMAAGQFAGMMVLVALMGLVFYNDIVRLVS